MMTGHGGASSPELLRIEKAVYGGDGLGRTEAGKVHLVPFVLPGELVAAPSPLNDATLQVHQASPDRVAPACVHFGVCGGCQYQMARYDTQLSMKAAILRETLVRAGVSQVPDPQVLGSPEPYGYRNRIRLHVRIEAGKLQLGYNVRGSRLFLPVSMCPIAAPVLWASAEAVLRVSEEHQPAAEWLQASAEIELLCDPEASKVQLNLLCRGPVPKRKGAFESFAERLQHRVPLASMRASRLHVASGRALETLACWGAEGLAYRVGDQTFWLTPGSFFQVNRFLLPTMERLVCGGRHGKLAWDLYAGVGLFARAMARQFDQVTAVEGNPGALDELRRGLRAGQDTAVQQTTLAFLRNAVVQRERPELIVLDPPRAGAGEEACALLLRLAPQQIVYVSCDPTTLARDLLVLENGYRVAESYMLDLFPQTYHLETVMVLHRRDVGV